MPTKALLATAQDIKRTLNANHASLAAASSSIKDQLITPGMSPEETLKAKSGILYHQLLLQQLEEIVSTQCQMFDLCVQAHSESAEAIRFSGRMKWMFSPKSLFWGIIGVVIAVTIYLYDTGGIPR